MLNDQRSRHDTDPNSHGAKLARALAYLRQRNIHSLQPGNDFKYDPHGSKVLRQLRRKAA